MLIAVVKEIVTKYRLASRKKKEKKEKKKRSILALSKWALAEFKKKKKKKGLGLLHKSPALLGPTSIETH